jgi:glutamate synthase domain-containing protein 3
VLDKSGDFITRCNLGMVDLEKVETAADIAELRNLIELHHAHTGSDVAARALAQWGKTLPQFVKVMPTDYKRVLEERARQQTIETHDNDADDRAVATAQEVQS